MIKRARYLLWLLLISFSLLQPSFLLAKDADSQDITVVLPKCKGSVYQILNVVSEHSGYMFIYDSQLFDNDKAVKIPAGKYSLTEAVHMITGDNRLEIRIVGDHILIFIPEPVVIAPPDQKTTSDEPFFTLSGTLKDRATGEPVIYGSIGVNNMSYGTVANNDGDFKLVLPDSLRHAIIRFSQIGYISREIDASLLSGQNIVFYMDQRVIPLQEVVVRVVDPLRTIREMMNRRAQNYSRDPVYLTTFFREGIEFKKSINLVEAVLMAYKAGFQSSVNNDQFKLIKMHRVANSDDTDTLITKVKSSLNSCLLLDLVKNPPDFLLSDYYGQYKFTHSDITTIEDRRIYVISFEQNEFVFDPLYKGKLYIDAENYALVMAHFEINPLYVRKSADELVLKRGKNLEVTPESVVYEVTYKPYNGIYYINHIRGDLNFKVRKKSRLFSSNLHVWFEMVNCKTDNKDVKRFPGSDKLPTRDIFSDTNFVYDKDFWEHFNVILPEDKLRDLVQKYDFGPDLKSAK
jgi:hypothetical protein